MRSKKWTIPGLGVILLLVLVYSISSNSWSCNSTAIPSSKLSTATKINILSGQQVYDLSGSEAWGGGDPFRLFDEQADPKNGVSRRPVTHPLPLQSEKIYFPEGKGLRMVVDLLALHDIQEVYWYDRSLDKDSVWLYTGTMRGWTPVVAHQTAGTPMAWGWKSFSVNQSSRYLMIRFSKPSAVITELVLYGTAKESISEKVPAASMPIHKKTLREFAGVNSYDYVPAHLLQPFRQTRLYQHMGSYDADSVHDYPDNEITLNYFNSTGSAAMTNWVDSIRNNGNELWMTLFSPDKNKLLTRPGMDPENPASYARHAGLFWHLAAVYGAAKCDTTLLNTKERPRYSGRSLMNRFENGNEDDAYWTTAYRNPVEYFAMSSADYDGHEGLLGKRCGIKNADSSSRLIASGMVQLDTHRVKTLKFLCEQWRSDRQFIWQGGVQYHYYSNAGSGKSSLPTKGISPEQDRMREKLAAVRRFHDRELPGIPLILGENGYDRMPTSWQATPVLPGRDAETSQAVMIVRSVMAAFMAGFDGYNYYMMRNATSNENAPGAYATSGMIGGPGNEKVYKAWHYWNRLIATVGDYEPDTVISESGEVWVYKLRHKQNKRKVAYYLVSPTTSGKVIKNFKLSSYINYNQLIKEFVMNDFSNFQEVVHAPGTAKQLEFTVSEFPSFVFLEE